MAALQVAPSLDFSLELGFLATHASGCAGVFPEIGLRSFAIKALQFGGELGEVKDGPATR
jgi:hypothetical protein